MTLGVEDSNLISISYGKGNAEALNNGLIYDRNFSEFEKVRQERHMFKQVLILAKSLDNETIQTMEG